MTEPGYLGQIIIDLYQLTGVPGSIHGLIAKNEKENHYSILINGDDDEPRRLATFLHETAHIYRRDLEKTGTTAAEIETETRRQLRAAAAILLQEGEQ